MLGKGRVLPSRPETGHQEIVFPNNVQKLRLAKKMTQRELGERMQPSLSVASISKIESGERRLALDQIRDLAEIFEVKPEEIPVSAEGDAEEARYWGARQRQSMEFVLHRGIAAAGAVIGELRREKGMTLQQLAAAIGKTVSVAHRMEKGVRAPAGEEWAQLAGVFKMSQKELLELVDKKAKEDREKLAEGEAPEELMPERPRALVWDDSGLRGLGVFERQVMRRSVRVVPRSVFIPVYGKLERRGNESVFVLNREGAEVERVAAPEFAGDGHGWFGVRIYSRRLGLLVRPGSLAYVEENASLNVGDIVVFVREEGRADCAIVSGDVLKAMTLRMFLPDEEIAIDDPKITAIYRVAGIVFPRW